MPIRSQTLSEEVSARVASPLQDTVVDYLSLASIVQQAHWAVIGPEFRSFHVYMDELAAELNLLTDATAERMLAVGVLPQGQVDYVAKHARVAPLPTAFVQKKELVVALTARMASIVGRIRERITVLEELDAVSADLLITATASLEKTLWMLQAENS